MGVDQGREWVTFTDTGTGVKYTFDVSFLLSGYRCTWGCGCKGINGDGIVGCCVEGAPMYTEADYVKTNRGAQRARELGVWMGDNLRDIEESFTFTDEDDEETEHYAHTEVTNGACIFANRTATDGGCALHIAALKDGADPEDYKPVSCWQYPLWYEDYEENDSGFVIAATIGPVQRNWAAMSAGYSQWWCIDDVANYDHAGGQFVPAYVSLKRTLVRMSSQQVWEKLYEWAKARLLWLLPSYGMPIESDGSFGDGRRGTNPQPLTQSVRITKKGKK